MSDLQVKIRVLEAHGLSRGDIGKSSSDPFVVAKFRGLGKMMNSVQTSVIHNTLNPVWNQDLTLYPKNNNDVLLLKVYDHDALSKNNLLGMVEIPLERFFQQGVQDWWVQLMNKKGSWKSLVGGHPTWYSVPGQLHIQLQFELTQSSTGFMMGGLQSQAYLGQQQPQQQQQQFVQQGQYQTQQPINPVQYNKETTQTFVSGFNPVLPPTTWKAQQQTTQTNIGYATTTPTTTTSF